MQMLKAERSGEFPGWLSFLKGPPTLSICMTSEFKPIFMICHKLREFRPLLSHIVKSYPKTALNHILMYKTKFSMN